MSRKILFSSLIISTLVILFNVFLVLYPREVLEAARDGLLLWFNHVLPSLLPFMVGINILTALGFTHFLGALLSPIMRPLFHIPGAGGFALLSGLTSGYPMGAKVTAFLRSEKQLSQAEAQRLMAFANNAGPLFIVGVVGAGLFDNINAGYCLWASHVLAAFGVGFLSRLGSSQSKRPSNISHSPLRQALSDWQLFRQKHDCSFGFVLGDSVKNAMESMTVIGGFIILFCVATRLLEMTLILPSGVWGGFGAGLLEITNGAHLIAQSSGGISSTQMMLAAAIISFGGFSIHAQALHFTQHTDIKACPYLLAKALHGGLAAFICWLLLPMFNLTSHASVPAMQLKNSNGSLSIALVGLCGLLLFATKRLRKV